MKTAEKEWERKIIEITTTTNIIIAHPKYVQCTHNFYVYLYKDYIHRAVCMLEYKCCAIRQ